MFRFLNVQIDAISFWVGFVTALLLWWIWDRARPTIRSSRVAIGERIQALREGLSSSTELRFRQDLVKILQDQHLTASLFSLEEIAIPARVLLHPTPIPPDADHYPYFDTVEQTLPFLPDWPEMAGVYQARNYSLIEALSGDADILLVGKPGSGKSFALQHLAFQIARRDPAVGEWAQRVPLYIDALQLELPAKDGNLIDVLYKLYAEQVGTLTEAQLPALFEALLDEGMALLMVDGLDEISAKEQRPIIEFVRAVQTRYPDNTLLAAASPDDINAMEALQLHPVFMAAWEIDQISNYIDRWTALWHEYTLDENWARSLNPAIDPMLIKGWLLKDALQDSPLILMLKTWAAFAGDARGRTPADALDAFVRRMSTGVSNARDALEQLAVQMVLNQNGVVERSTAGSYVASFEDPAAPPDLKPVKQAAIAVEGLEDFEDELDALLGDVDGESSDQTKPFIDSELDALLDEIDQRESGQGEQQVKDRNVRRMLPELVRSGLLTYRPNGRIGFTHPVLLGYLAGCGLAQRGGAAQLLTHPYWSGKSLAWEYFSVSGNIAELMRPLFEKAEADPLKRGLLVAATWTRNAPADADWRASVMRGLARFLTLDNLPFTVRAKLVTALAFSGESSIGALFRRLLTLPSPDARKLGALGSGLARYDKAVPELTELLFQQDVSVGRAACLALVAIGTTEALESVASALLGASDEVRQAAAEALASDPIEGYAILRDGAKVTDLLVRRAVAYGLARINQPWAREILDDLQLNDDQWAVRSAAEQAIQSLEEITQVMPTSAPELFTLSWLVAYAAGQGQGLSPGDGSWETLRYVLRNGDGDQILSALAHLRLSPQRARESLDDIYGLLRGHAAEMREAAFDLLWYMGASGVDLPDPDQIH
jgi:HEAT repeat protein